MIRLSKELARFKNLHVRVSIKGSDKDEYRRLTGARSDSYELPFVALENLINSCLVMHVMVSFSDKGKIKKVKKNCSIYGQGY